LQINATTFPHATPADDTLRSAAMPTTPLRCRQFVGTATPQAITPVRAGPRHCGNPRRGRGDRTNTQGAQENSEIWLHAEKFQNRDRGTVNDYRHRAVHQGINPYISRTCAGQMIHAHREVKLKQRVRRILISRSAPARCFFFFFFSFPNSRPSVCCDQRAPLGRPYA